MWMANLGEYVCVHCERGPDHHVATKCLFGPTSFKAMTADEYAIYAVRPAATAGAQFIRDALASQGFARSILPAVPIPKKEDEP